MSNRDSVAPLAAFVSRVTGGGTPARSLPSNWTGPIPWASVKDLAQDNLVLEDTEEHISVRALHESASNLIPAGIPIVCTRMAVGRVAMPTVDMAINQDLKALFPAYDVDSRYLLHGIHFLQPRLEAVATGSTVKGLQVRELLAFRLYKPAISEQRRIAGILGTMDDQIRLTESATSKLRATFVGLLGHLLTRGVRSGRGSLGDAPLELGEASTILPKSWTIEPIGRLLGPVDPAMRSGPFGSALLKHELVESGVPLLGIDNVHVDQFVSDFRRFVTPAKAVELSRYRVPAGRRDDHDYGHCWTFMLGTRRHWARAVI